MEHVVCAKQAPKHTKMLPQSQQDPASKERMSPIMTCPTHCSRLGGSISPLQEETTALG